MRTRQYWFRLLRFAALLLAAVLILLPLLLGFVSVWGLTHPFCNPGGTPAQYGLNYEEITFASSDGITQQGYFIPGSSGATVIIAPAYANGRGGDLHYAAIFNRAGFNVITFNGRVCTSYGHTSLGYVEIRDVRAAYDYLGTRPELDRERVTLHGFSSAGATVLMAAAEMPQIRGVSAEGNYVNLPDALGIGDQQSNYAAALFLWASETTYQLVTGYNISVLRPIEVVGNIGARPVLLIYGSRDGAINEAPRLRDAAAAGGAQVELWVIEGAGHGSYIAVAGAEFERRVITFHCGAVGGVLELELTPRCA